MTKLRHMLWTSFPSLAKRQTLKYASLETLRIIPRGVNPSV
jgi:hypothetical protein